MTAYRSTFETIEQALVEALFLGLMAPGEEEAQAAALLAEELAYGLDAESVELCKAAALETTEVPATVEDGERVEIIQFARPIVGPLFGGVGGGRPSSLVF